MDTCNRLKKTLLLLPSVLMIPLFVPWPFNLFLPLPTLCSYYSVMISLHMHLHNDNKNYDDD